MCCNIHDHVCRLEFLLGMLKCGVTKLHVVLVLRVLNAMVLWSFILQAILVLKQY